MNDLLVVAATQPELASAGATRTTICGIGPVEAAAATARALAQTPARRVLHVGLAGARELAPGTVVIGSEAVYCDLSAAVPLVDRVAADTALVGRARAALPVARLLAIGTSARVGGGSLEVEAMEGFAVLRAAELAGVPAVEARVVSNALGEEDRALWRFDEAFARVAELLPRLVAAARG